MRIMDIYSLSHTKWNCKYHIAFTLKYRRKLFYYKKRRYSVPIKFINTTLEIKENNNKLYVYYNRDLVTVHEISEKNINYKEEHYIEGLSKVLKSIEQEDIEKLAKENLERLNRLCEV